MCHRLLNAHVVAATNNVHNNASVDSTAPEIVGRFIKMYCGEKDDVLYDSVYLHGCDFLTPWNAMDGFS